jgi:glycosyltransferase involved in cell wall biosynthesis
MGEGKRPTVTVIIPAYNHGRFLGEALESVLAQTYQDLEVLVVDDGSTDDTQAVVARNAPSVHYIRQSHAGPAAARNRGIAASHGELIAFLDADDRWYPGKVAFQVAYLDAHPQAGVVFTKFLVTDEWGRALYAYPHTFRYGHNPFEALLVWPYGSMNTAMIKRVCLEKVGVFDENLTGAEDWDLWLRLAPHYDFGYVDSVLATYRQSAGSQSRGTMALRAPVMFRLVLDKLFADPGRLAGRDNKDIARLRRRAYASLEITVALNMSGRPWTHLARAAAQSPSILTTRWRAVGLLLFRSILGDQRTRVWDEAVRRALHRLAGRWPGSRFPVSRRS